MTDKPKDDVTDKPKTPEDFWTPELRAMARAASQAWWTPERRAWLSELRKAHPVGNRSPEWWLRHPEAKAQIGRRLKNDLREWRRQVAELAHDPGPHHRGKGW